MIFPYFLAYMAIGFTAALALFAWALRRGQFRDQQRARFLPLEPGALAAAAPVRASRRARIETAVLFALALAGLACSGALVVFSLAHGGR